MSTEPCPYCGKNHPPLGRDPEYIPHKLTKFLEQTSDNEPAQGEADAEAEETSSELAGIPDNVLPVQHGEET